MNRAWTGVPSRQLRLLSRVVWLILVGAYPDPASLAQTTITGTISGRVFDADSASQTGLVGASLTLTNRTTALPYKTRSDQRGNYSFEILPPGLYKLSCELEGYENLDGTLLNVEVKLTDPTELLVPPFALRRTRNPQTAQVQPSLTETPPRIHSYKTDVEPRPRLSKDWRALATAVPVLFQAFRTQKDSQGPHVGNEPSNTGRLTLARLAEPGSAILTESEFSLFATDTDTGPQSGQIPSTPPQHGTPSGTTRASPGRVKLVNGINATRGGAFTNLQLLSLPLQGTRTFDALALLLPGVVNPPHTLSATPGPGIGSSVGTAGQFSANGLPSRANNFTVDGSDNNDQDIGVRRQGFTSLVPQSIDSVNQLYIATLLPNPQFGRNMGAQVNAVSHYGGESYHGTVYGLLTDKRLNARDFFDYSTKAAPANYGVSTASGAQVTLDGKPLFQPNPVEEENPFTRAQYGLVFGGPVSSNRKSFFFASLERQQINARKESHFAVPTVDDRGLNRSGGTGLGTRFDPVFPTSVIGDAFFSLFPFPNNPIGPFGQNTYTEVLPASAHGTILSLKVDQGLGLKHVLTGRYNLTDDDTILPVTGEALFSSLRPRVRTQNLSLFLSSAASPSLSNEARFSFGRTHLHFDKVPSPQLLPSKRFPNEPFLLNSRWIVNNTLPGRPPQYSTTYSTTGNQRLPLGDVESAAIIQVPGAGLLPIGPLGQVIISGFSPMGVDVFNFPQERTNNIFQSADAFFHNRGRHRITAGFDTRRTQLNSNLERNFRPLAVFNGARNLSLDLLSEAERAAIRNTVGFAFDSPVLPGSDFVSVGSPNGFFQTQALVRDATIGLRYWENSFFFSDQIRVKPSFTLTLGVRYEYNTVPSEVNKRIEKTFADPEVQKLPDLVRVLNGRNQIYGSDRNNFAPHVAFAWDPFGSGKTSVRAGYGIFYDQILGAVVSQSRNVFPSFVTFNFAGLNAEVKNNSYQFSNGLSFINPVELAVPGTLNTYNQSLLGPPADFIIGLDKIFSGLSAGAAGAAFTLPADDLQTPYSQHWALTIERQIRGSFVTSVAYVGTRGLHLLRFATPNLGPRAIPLVEEVSVGRTLLTAFQPLFLGSHIAPGFDPNAMTGGRPAPLLGSYTSIESDASSSYHSLQLQLNKQWSHNLQFTTSYTWSHAIDEVSDLFDLAGARAIAQNSFNRRAERAAANFDVRHRFVYSAVWHLPFLERSNILGGWRVAGIGTFQTGQPYSKYSCCDANSDGNFGDRILTTAQGTVIQQAARNVFRGPGLASVDLAAEKGFRFGKSQSLNFRSEFFNLFNRTHFGIPVNEELFPGADTSVDTRVPARTIQFSLKYHF